MFKPESNPTWLRQLGITAVSYPMIAGSNHVLYVEVQLPTAIADEMTSLWLDGMLVTTIGEAEVCSTLSMREFNDRRRITGFALRIKRRKAMPNDR